MPSLSGHEGCNALALRALYPSCPESVTYAGVVDRRLFLRAGVKSLACETIVPTLTDSTHIHYNIGGLELGLQLEVI